MSNWYSQSPDERMKRVLTLLEELSLHAWEIFGCEQFFEDADKEKKEFVDKAYIFCHIGRGICKNKHEDWVEEFEKLEEKVLWRSKKKVGK